VDETVPTAAKQKQWGTIPTARPRIFYTLSGFAHQFAKDHPETEMTRLPLVEFFLIPASVSTSQELNQRVPSLFQPTFSCDREHPLPANIVRSSMHEKTDVFA
jgi:hypothetical protein